MLAPATDLAIAVSKSTAEFVINARQMPPERVKVVYLGVPLEEFSRNRTVQEIAEARHELGALAGEFVAGTVTRLHDSKGNSYLVDAAQSVLRDRPNARFYLFGEGPLRPDLEAQASALGLAIGSCSAASRGTSPARSRPSTSTCFPRSGKGRR